jgi:hypothetical protein
MAKTFAEYARERRARMGSEGRDAERVFRAHYASLTDEDILDLAVEDDDEAQD